MLRREVFYITTDAGAEADARQAALARRTQPVPDGEADLLLIESFVHVYDAEQARAWMERAVNPLINGRPALSLPYDGAAGLGDGTPRPRTRAAKLRLLGLVGVTEGMARADALVRLRTPRSFLPPHQADLLTLANRVAQKPSGWRVVLDELAPETLPAWERVAYQIDGLAPAAQDAVIWEQLVAIQKFFRAMNVCYTAILPLRRWFERAFGYFTPDSDQYVNGMPAAIIRGRLMASQPAPYRGGWWREWLAGWQRARFGTDRGTWNPGDVIFGLESTFNADGIGCYQGTDATNIIFPNNCDRPTGESHRVWFQSDATLAGGRGFPWDVIVRALGNGETTAGHAGNRLQVPGGAAQAGWMTPLFDPVTTMLQPWRLYAAPPLEWYWRAYFESAPEFNGRSFAEWVLETPAAEFIRRARRENTQRNLLTAARFQTLVEALPGMAQAAAVQQHLQSERSSLREGQAVAQVGTTIATGAALTGPVGSMVGLIAGVASFATVGLMQLMRNNLPEIRADVFGAATPVFSQFGIVNDRARFSALSAQSIGMPQAAAGTFSPLAVVGSYFALAGRVRIEGMPHYGATFVDGQRSDDTASRWEDDTLQVWSVPATAGAHRLTVQPPDGAVARTATVNVPPGGTATVRFAEMTPETQLQVVDESPTASSTPSLPWWQMTSGTEPPPPPPPSRGGLLVAVVGVLTLGGAGAYYLTRRKRNRPRRRTRR